MITISQLTEMLGWASILNIGFLAITTLLILVMKPMLISTHSKMFGVPESELPFFYFKYLAAYKILIFIFILSPYAALKIIGY